MTTARTTSAISHTGSTACAGSTGTPAVPTAVWRLPVIRRPTAVGTAVGTGVGTAVRTGVATGSVTGSTSGTAAARIGVSGRTGIGRGPRPD